MSQPGCHHPEDLLLPTRLLISTLGGMLRHLLLEDPNVSSERAQRHRVLTLQFSELKPNPSGGSGVSVCRQGAVVRESRESLLKGGAPDHVQRASIRNRACLLENWLVTQVLNLTHGVRERFFWRGGSME